MTKTVFAAVCGRANAGKSSLVNLLVGEKVAIVSEKPQTTRTRINGILTVGDVQYVFTDTPGLHRERTALSRHMMKSAADGVDGVDVVLLVADCGKKPGLREELRVISGQTDVILLLNKVDLLKDKTALLGAIESYSKLYDFAEIIPISVKDKINTEKIIPLLDKYAVENQEHSRMGGFYFEPGICTDQPEKMWLSELIREKLLYELREEIPHGIAVQIEAMEYSKTNKGAEIVDLSVAIICEKQSHKGMIIGKQGGLLKKIGSVARAETEEYLQSKVNMKLWVKVAENWRNSESLINEFGLKSE